MTDYDALRLDHQICFPLYSAARKITSAYTPLLKPLGITYTQYIVFMALWEKDGQTVGEICRKLYLDSGTITPVLKKMETKGWIERRRDRKDERVVVVHLSSDGWDMREKCKNVPFEMGKCVGLNQKDAAALYRILYEILDPDKKSQDKEI